MSREIRHRYQDPLDLIWLALAEEIGIEVVRSSEVYASFDGGRTLTLSSSEHFDADDSLAQLIFHEICHGLVAGDVRARLPDWGMANEDDRDLLQEHACHRLQAALAASYGLRDFFAVTTDHRPYWDSLPINPLQHGRDPAIAVAREAYARAVRGKWAEPLKRALTKTQELAALMRTLPLPEDSLWRRTRAIHASGYPEHHDPALRCGDCAFVFTQGAVLRCRKSKNATLQARRVHADARACERFEARFGEEMCAPCGACCREGFDRVDVRARDLVRKRHPDLIKVDAFGPHLPRPQGLCVALENQGDVTPNYRCRIYSERPRSCAEFEVAGDACLTARQRIGLSS